MRKLLVLLWFWSFISFSQQSEWEFYKDIDGVKFEIRTIEYPGNELLTFKFQTRMIILFKFSGRRKYG